MVEQVMAKPDDLPILKLIALIDTAHKDFRRKAHSVRLAGLGETQIIILKGSPLLERYIEAGVPAEAEMQHFILRVIYSICHLNSAFLESVSHLKQEGKGTSLSRRAKVTLLSVCSATSNSQADAKPCIFI